MFCSYKKPFLSNMVNCLIYLREFLLLKRFFQESWRAVLARKGSSGNSCPDCVSSSETTVCRLPQRSRPAACEPVQRQPSLKARAVTQLRVAASYSDEYKSCFSLDLSLHSLCFWKRVKLQWRRLCLWCSLAPSGGRPPQAPRLWWLFTVRFCPKQAEE